MMTNPLRPSVAVALIAACAMSTVVAQSGVHPVTGRQFAGTMSVEGAPWLERREREREEDPDLGLRLLKVAKGSTVGDVGAGSGYMSLRLARLRSEEHTSELQSQSNLVCRL